MKKIHFLMIFVLSSFSYQGMSQGLYKQAYAHEDMLFKNEGRENPLHKAASRGDIKKVRKLLAKGTDVNARNSRKQTAMHVAAEKGHMEIVKLLLAAGADMEAVEPKHKGTVLHLAAKKGHVEMVKLLLMEGANLNVSCVVPGMDYNIPCMVGSALHIAASHGQLEVVRLLVNEGAITYARDPFGRKSIYYARKNGFSEVADFLKEAEFRGRYFYLGEKPAPILSHADSGNLKEVQRLLSGGDIDVNVRHRNGLTLLIAAVTSQNVALVRFLLEKGADVQARIDRVYYRGSNKAWSYNEKDEDRPGRSGWFTYNALEAAASFGTLEMVKVLVEAGSPLNPEGNYASTPLYKAIPWGDDESYDHHLEVMEYLIEQGVDMNRKDQWIQRTPMHMVARYGNKKAAALLVKAGGNLEARDVHGLTPVLVAAFHHSYDVFKVYADAGADLKVKNEFGKSALDLLKENPSCPLDMKEYE